MPSVHPLTPDGVVAGVVARADEYDGIRSLDELYDRFVPRFFFGCEADDPMTPVAFDPRRVPGGKPLAATSRSTT